jgi:hypothetical protein
VNAIQCTVGGLCSGAPLKFNCKSSVQRLSLTASATYYRAMMLTVLLHCVTYILVTHVCMSVTAVENGCKLSVEAAYQNGFATNDTAATEGVSFASTMACSRMPADGTLSKFMH